MRVFEKIRGSAVLCLGGMCFAVLAEQGNAMSQQRARPVVSFSCEVAAPHPESLCQALMQALSQQVPQAVVRSVDVPDGKEALLISLEAEALSRRQMTGRLSWKIGAGPVQRGPEIGFDVMDDAELSATVYDGFARGLIMASPELQQALRLAGEN